MVQSLALSMRPLPALAHNMDANSLDSMPTSSADSDAAATANPFTEVPLTALSTTTRRQLSNLLNAKKVLRSEEGYERDWRGIAALSQQKNLCDEQTLSAEDAIAKVLQLWCSNNPKTATFAYLERFLGIIDRWDACDDIYENLLADAKTYTTRQYHKTMSQGVASDEADSPQLLVTSSADSFGIGSDANILTKDDVRRAQEGLPPQNYDAFVLFADADINYATEMLTKLEENPVYNFKLCSKDRDLLAGVSFTHVALTQLIEERCKYLIVILTQEFIKSPENKFLVNYTQALQIQYNTRKIIPLLYEEGVPIPRTLKIYTHLRYNANAAVLFDFWGKLAASIRNVSVAVESPPCGLYTKDTCSFTTTRSTLSAVPSSANNTRLPATPTTTTTATAPIPSISINGHTLPAESVGSQPQKVERNRYKKRSLLRQNGFSGSSGKISMSQDPMLRNAHSTSQLNAGYYDSISDLSTTSGYCDATGKKKKRWSSKLFKKVFSRSSTKLQETA